MRGPDFKDLLQKLAWERQEFVLDVSRLSRSSTDWSRLLDICAITDTVIVETYYYEDVKIMSNQPKWGTQSKISHRPRFMRVEPQFFICRRCGNMVTQVMVENTSAKITCCGQPMCELVPNTADASSEEHLPVYVITGGFANNAVTVEIGRTPHPMTEEHHIEWVCLYTFQGGQLKYLAAA